MSSDASPDIAEIKENTKDLTDTIGRYFEAHPNETQTIFTHVINQVLDRVERERWRSRIDDLHNRSGFERIIVLERRRIEVRKRIFHMSSGETVTGIDFLLTKNNGVESRYIAIQVKRNRREAYFAFGQREKLQFNRFKNTLVSGYYLFVDESGERPVEYFVSLSDLRVLLKSADSTDAGISRLENDRIRRIGQDPRSVYDRFYDCEIGRRYNEPDLVSRASRFSADTDRAIVELWNKPGTVGRTARLG